MKIKELKIVQIMHGAWGEVLNDTKSKMLLFRVVG